MYISVLVLHIIVVVSLMTLILIQRGRSGGLVEALGGVESIFGTKTNAFFVKATITLSVLFFCTSISLVLLGKEKSKSLMERYRAPVNVTANVTSNVTAGTPAEQTKKSIPTNSTVAIPAVPVAAVEKVVEKKQASAEETRVPAAASNATRAQ